MIHSVNKYLSTYHVLGIRDALHMLSGSSLFREGGRQ